MIDRPLKILVVDDQIHRHVNFLRWLRDHVIVNAGSYKEAVEALNTGSPYDVVYLDYDLGTWENGADVASYIISLPTAKWPQRVIIHSLHPIGVLRIRRILSRVQIPNQIEPHGFDFQSLKL